MSRITIDGGKIQSFADNKCLVCGNVFDQLFESKLTINLPNPDQSKAGELIPMMYTVGVCDDHRHKGPDTTQGIQSYLVVILASAKKELGLPA